jgi:uncharacterized protein
MFNELHRRGDLMKVLLLCGGIIHDWQGVGDVLSEILSGEDDLHVDRVNDDLDTFTDPAQYDVIVFYHTRGELSDAQKNGLFNAVAAGTGFVGLHGATVSFKGNPSWDAFIGGSFIGHPAPREYTVSVVDDTHPITEGLDEFTVFDEQYLIDHDPRVHVLATALHDGIAETVAWTKDWTDGRIYYLALGHDPDAARNPAFAGLLIRGIRWAGKTL